MYNIVIFLFQKMEFSLIFKIYQRLFRSINLILVIFLFQKMKFSRSFLIKLDFWWSELTGQLLFFTYKKIFLTDILLFSTYRINLFYLPFILLTTYYFTCKILLTKFNYFYLPFFTYRFELKILAKIIFYWPQKNLPNTKKTCQTRIKNLLLNSTH